MSIRNTVVISVHALVGWALCAATMGIGIVAVGLRTALITHAVAVPIIFAVVSALYFALFAYTSPLKTAVAFVAIVVFLDVTVVAMLVEHSYAMFTSVLGTWLPFALIFASTYITGIAMTPHPRKERAIR